MSSLNVLRNNSPRTAFAPSRHWRILDCRPGTASRFASLRALPFSDHGSDAGRSRLPSRILRYTMIRHTWFPVVLVALSAVSAGCHHRIFTCGGCEPPPCCGAGPAPSPSFAPPPMMGTPGCASCGSSPVSGPAGPSVPGFTGPIGQPVGTGFPAGSGYPISSGYPITSPGLPPGSVFTSPPTQVIPPPQIVPPTGGK